MLKSPRGHGVVLCLAFTALLGACAPEETAAPEVAAVVEAAKPRVEPRHILTAENTHNRFSRTIPPRLTVASGAVVEVFTKETTDGQLNADSTAADIPHIRREAVHPLTGPIAVEGAEPGDVLKVTLYEIEVGEWGWSGVIPGLGYLADDFPDPYLKTFRFEKGARYMIDYLVEERGMERNEAYVLASLAGDLKISEVVDKPHVLVSMHMPKSIFNE